MRRALLASLSLFGLLLCLPGSSSAQVPPILHFQGRLLDAGGAPVSDQVNLEFRLYADAMDGDALWTERHGQVGVSGGAFQVYLGLNAPFEAVFADGEPRFLGIAVNGGDELTPRQPIAASAYAMLAAVAVHAQTCSEAETLGPWAPDDLVSRADFVAHISNEEAHPARYTDAEAVAALLAADGPGSGLDADSLDGLAGEDLALAGHDHAGAYAPGDHAHADLYSPLAHDHAGSYSLEGHTHAELYAAAGHAHADLYAPLAHDHADLYAPVAHDHAEAYAEIAHHHDERYLLAQEGAVTGDQIEDGSLTFADLGELCDPGQVLKVDAEGQGWACGDDVTGSEGDVTAVAAGDGLEGGGEAGELALAVDFGATQRRIGGTCPDGQAMVAVDEAGSVECRSAGGAYLAGDGLALDEATFSVLFDGTGEALMAARSDHGHPVLEAHLLDGAAHAARYTDDEARLAMGDNAPGNPYHHDRYADDDARSAMGALGDGNPFHHTRYSDDEAVAAVGTTLEGLDCDERSVAVFDGLVWSCQPHQPFEFACGEGEVLARSGNSWSCSSDYVRRPERECAGDECLVFEEGRLQCRPCRRVPNDVSRGNAYTFEVRDAWGIAWDGLQRVPQTYPNARADCAAHGGRLPTSNELYRVNHGSGTAEVGDVTNTDYLWTEDFSYTLYAVTRRLSDGNPTRTLYGTPLPYRCVWDPAPRPAHFAGVNCHGDPQGPCVTVTDGLSVYLADGRDRATLYWAEAAEDCRRSGGRLPTELELVHLIRGGLPNGSNSYVWAHSSGNGNFIVQRWQGAENDAYNYSANWTHAGPNNWYNYRCISQPLALSDGGAPVFPQAVAEPAFEVDAVLRVDAQDRIAPNWFDANEACMELGGRLATLDEMQYAIRRGLPGGDNGWRWTRTTYSGYNSWLVRWSGVADFRWDYNANRSNAGWSASHPFRCSYRPNRQYDEDALEQLVGMGLVFRVDTGDVSYFVRDLGQDSGGSNIFSDAETAYWWGMRLWDAPELVYMVRQGLPNGSNAYLMTSTIHGWFSYATFRWLGQQDQAYDPWPLRSNASWSANNSFRSFTASTID